MVNIPVPEQFAELNKNSIETALRLAKISMESAERLVNLQIEAAKAALEENAKNAKAMLEAKNPQDVVALRTQLTEAAVERAMSYSRTVYEVASQTQAELAQLLEDRMSAYSKDVAGAVDKATKSAPAGSEFAVAALKSTMAATAAAVETMTKAAKQLTEFADASVKAATSATSEAVKGGGKGRGK